MFNNDQFEEMGYIRCNSNEKVYTITELLKILEEDFWEEDCAYHDIELFLKWLKKEEKK